MKRLYWDDTYLMRHQAKITVIGNDENGDYLRLDETIFHPQGGGQPSDEGTINSTKVTKLKDLRDINEINHYVEDISQFSVGDIVSLEIDQEKRLECAALHTAGHITAGILRTVNHYKEQISANHFPNQSKVEFKLEGNISKTNLEENANMIINAAKRITQEYSDTGLRCINIDGLWTESCSGTHLNNTSEIIKFEVRKIEAKKGRLIVGYNAKYCSKDNN